MIIRALLIVGGVFFFISLVGAALSIYFAEEGYEDEYGYHRGERGAARADVVLRLFVAGCITYLLAVALWAWALS